MKDKDGEYSMKKMFALILAAILALLAYAAYRLLMKNVNKYYCAG